MDVCCFVGGLDAMLTLPFHGPLHDAILTLLDTEVLDEATLAQVHAVLELRLNHMDTLLDELFTGQLQPLFYALPGE